MPPAHDAADHAERALEAQLLATEHWSLLASRSTTQGEVLTRIAIFLTLFSAGLLAIGLLGQATDFGGWFRAAALGILAFIWLVGFLTQVRVMNVAEEDMMYVVAMNRLRGAYRELRPGIERNFLASTHDDEAGADQTYYFFRNRGISQAFGSSALLITVVNSTVLGLFAGGLVVALGGAVPWAVVAGAVVALMQLVASIWYSVRRFLHAWRHFTPLHPSVDSPPTRFDRRRPPR